MHSHGAHAARPEDSGTPLLARQSDALNHASATVPSEYSALSLRVTEDRVLIRADREDHAPTQTEAGLYVAQSMAAAVDGSDEAESWFVGTIVQVGPLVNRFEARPAILRWLWDAETEGIGLSPGEVR